MSGGRVPEPTITRNIRARETGYRHLPLLAVSLEDGDFLAESIGEILPISGLVGFLLDGPPSLVIVQNAAQLVKQLDSQFDDDPNWQFRLTPIERRLYNRRDEGKRVVKHRSVPAFFGWRRPTSRRNQYHYPLDPISFLGDTIDGLRPRNGKPRVVSLYEWGGEVRDFLRRHNLPARSSSGGVAAQLLRDSRFFDFPRRQVPPAINERAREQLPGNHYQLVDECDGYATYIDMSGAHHYCAEQITFPHPDRLRAKGDYTILRDDLSPGRPWALPGGARFERVTGQHGLLLANVRGVIGRDVLVPPCMCHHGYSWQFVYSNELEMIEQCGGRIDGIAAAWTSDEIDPGLNRYAKWALDELSLARERGQNWVKPLLLAPYGLLAARPRTLRFGFKRATKGEAMSYPVGAGLIRVQEVKTRRELTPPFTNVLYRGMIEAECRKRTIMLARELRQQGVKVISIYADSLFVSSRDELPLLPAPWKVKRHLTALRFHSSVSFTSSEMERHPGVPGDRAERISEARVRAARRPIGSILPRA